MTTTDTFIRSAVDTCLPSASIEQKYYWRKRLAGILDDRKNGHDVPTSPTAAKLAHNYNRQLHAHIKLEHD